MNEPKRQDHQSTVTPLPEGEGESNKHAKGRWASARAAPRLTPMEATSGPTVLSASVRASARSPLRTSEGARAARVRSRRTSCLAPGAATLMV